MLYLPENALANRLRGRTRSQTSILVAMSHLRRYWYVALISLLIVQGVLVMAMLQRETLTLDEADHSYSGYRMWHDADFGINPEHPPLVKLVATIPLLGRSLWLPPINARHFKTEAYVGGRDFWDRND